MDRFHRILIVACYFFGVLLAGPVLIIEREHELVRLHAAQALFFHLALLVLFVPASCAGVWFVLHGMKPLGLALMGIATAFEAVMAVAWLLLLAAAARGRFLCLPWLARLAREAIQTSRA